MSPRHCRHTAHAGTLKWEVTISQPRVFSLPSSVKGGSPLDGHKPPSSPAALSEITFLPGLFGGRGRGGLLVPLGHRLVEKLVDRVDDVGPHQGEAAETPVSKLRKMCL